MKRTGIDKNCIICGKEFYVSGWKIKRGEGLFCSWDCHTEKRKEQIPWNKGLSRDEETKRKISQKLIGRKTGRSPNKGKKQSPETIAKRVAKIKGQKRTREFCMAISLRMRGSNSPFWKGGISKINKDIRQSFEYKQWKKAVFERDKYTCINCGKKGCYIEADHIKPFSLYPELRFDINNGRTLCKECHLSIGWRISNRDSQGRFATE